jgi:citrate synthase
MLGAVVVLFSYISANSSTQPATFRSIIAPTRRSYATSTEPDLKTTLKECIPGKRELLKKVKTHSNKVIGEVKVENTLGGMRYVRSGLWRTWS